MLINALVHRTYMGATIQMRVFEFTEVKLEKAFIELLGNENYSYHLDINIDRAVDEVLIEADSKLSIAPVKFII